MVVALNVILDLDNTIINTLPIENAYKFMDKFHFSIFRSNSFLKDAVIARPHLDEFLDWLFANCKVSVFTHADKDYAMFVINNFIIQGKKNRKIDIIYYRYHVNMGLEIFGGYKDLRLLWDEFKVFDFYPSNTLIIDDNPMVKKTNPYNTLQIYPFDASENTVDDDHLLKVKEILKTLSKLYNKNIKNLDYVMVPILKIFHIEIDEVI